MFGNFVTEMVVFVQYNPPIKICQFYFNLQKKLLEYNNGIHDLDKNEFQSFASFFFFFFLTELLNLKITSSSGYNSTTYHIPFVFSFPTH